MVGFPLRAGDGTLPLSGQNNCGDPPRPPIFAYPGMKLAADLHVVLKLTLNIPSLARQRCLSSWGPRRTPCFFFFCNFSTVRRVLDGVVLAWCLLCTAAAVRRTSGR